MVLSQDYRHPDHCRSVRFANSLGESKGSGFNSVHFRYIYRYVGTAALGCVTWLIGMPAGSKEADAVLIFGGDGTVHRYLEQLVKLQLPVLVVPRGSGNDFARAVHLKKVRDAVGAWRKFVSGEKNARAIDLGVITSHVADPELLKLGPSPTSICDANESAEGAGKADSSRLKPFGMTRAQQPLARMKAVNLVLTAAR